MMVFTRSCISVILCWVVLMQLLLLLLRRLCRLMSSNSD